MFANMLDTPVSDSRDVASSSPASIRNERQPLLDHERDSDRISSEEDEVNKDASPSLALIVRQIFTARQFAVMLCFFMNGLCTTGIGVCHFASCLVVNILIRSRH